MDLVIAVLRFIWILFLVIMMFNLMIVVHEWGHFLAGRWRGLHIDRFQIWFGKPIWKKTYNGVQYGLGTIPMGGFVSLPQMAPMEAIEGAVAPNGEGEAGEEKPKRELPPISALDKIIVAFAGPLFSFLLAVFFACIVWLVGMPEADRRTAKEVGYVFDESPAAEAGILPGDEIVSVGGQPVKRIHGMVDSVDWYVVSSEQDELVFEVLRDGEKLFLPVEIPKEPTEEEAEAEAKKSLWVRARDFVFKRKPLPQVGIYGRETPRVGMVAPNGPAEESGIEVGDLILALNGKEVVHRIQVGEFVKDLAGEETITVTIGRDGETRDITVHPRIPEKRPDYLDYPIMGITWDNFGKGEIMHPTPGQQIGDSLRMMKNTLGAVFSPKSEIGATHLSSAVGIMRLYYRLFEHPDGWQLVLWFSVVLNVNLAILNMLPFPVLDGGHIVMGIVEGIRKKPVLNLKALEIIQTAAVILLMGLMLMLVLKDFGDIASDAKGGTGVEFLPRDSPPGQ